MVPNPNLLFYLLLCITINIDAENEIDSKHLSVESMCLAKLRQTLDHKEIAKRTLDGIVGIGWDDLMSTAAYPVFSSNFSECRTTPDGAFLIPNGVLAIPILQTHLDRMADYFKSFDEVKNGLKKWYSIGGGASSGNASIGGSYSNIYQETKTIIHEHKASMLVTKLVHEAYLIVADVAVGPLSPAFRARMMEVAKAISDKLPHRTEYLAEMIVKDFGTHVVLRAKTGAMIEEQIYIDSSTTFERKETLAATRAAASIGFLSKISIGANAEVGKEVTTEERKTLSHITLHSLTRTMGGPTVRHMLGGDIHNNSVFEVDTLVGISHDGLPLSALINVNHFPNLNQDILEKLHDSLKSAISKYYEMNTIRGCTDIDAPNFNFQANVDDGSCKPVNNSYPFGGTYQLCEPLPEMPGTTWEQSDDHPFNCSKGGCAFITPKYRCDAFAQANYFTGQNNCPKDYEPIQVAAVKHSLPDRIEEHSKSHCNYFVVFRTCHDSKWKAIYKDQIKLTSFWCRKKPNVTLHPEEGVMFGGIFKGDGINIFTDEKGCPPTYLGYRLGIDVTVCLGRDYELGKKYAIPFGGFFSCQTPEKHRHCPKGYSQHLATINDNCAIYYCVRSGVFKRFEPPLIKRPPFIDEKAAFSNYTQSSLEMHKFGQLMMRIPILDIATGLTDEKRSLNQRLLQPNDAQNVIPNSEVLLTVNEFIKKPQKAVAKMAQTNEDYYEGLTYFDNIFSDKIPPHNVPKSAQKLVICLSIGTVVLNVSLLFALII